MARIVGLIVLLLGSSGLFAVIGCPNYDSAKATSEAHLAACNTAGKTGCFVQYDLTPTGCLAGPQHRFWTRYYVGSVIQSWQTARACCTCASADPEGTPPTAESKGAKWFTDPDEEFCLSGCTYKPDPRFRMSGAWWGQNKPTGAMCGPAGGGGDPDPDPLACAEGEICLNGNNLCRTSNGETVCVPIAPDSNCGAGDTSALCLGRDEPSPPPPDPPIPPLTPPAPGSPTDAVSDTDGPAGPAPPVVIVINGYDGPPVDPEEPPDDPGDPPEPPDDPDDPVTSGPPTPPCTGINCTGSLGTCVTDPTGPGCEDVDDDGDPETPPNPYCASNPGSVNCNGLCESNPSSPVCAPSLCNPQIEQCDGQSACQLNPGAPGCAGFCDAHPTGIGCPGFCAANGNAPGCSDGTCNPAIEQCGQCVLNPESPGCSDGTCDPETEVCDDGEVSGGGDCDTAPECSGDEILCAVLYQQWETRCLLQPGEDEEEEEPPTKEQVTDESNINPAEHLPPVPGLGACPAFPSFHVFGRSYNADEFGHMCQLMSIASVMLMIFATYISGRIIAGGM